MMVEKHTVLYGYLVLCSIFVACGTVASVKPMGAGNKSLTFSAGGPVAPIYGIKMPLPYSVLRYRFGLNNDTDVHIGLHSTIALLGDLGFDMGLTRHFARNVGLRPGISAGVSLYGYYYFAEAGSTRLYPELVLLLTYDVSERVRVIYVGVENMFQFTEPYIVPACLLGIEFALGKRFAISTEARWYAPTQSGDDRVVDYTITPFKQGAVGFVLGVSYDLKGRSP